MTDIHIVQSPEWGEFKAQMGTSPVRVGDIQFTKHPIPFTPFYIGYAPKVNFLIQKFSWTELKAVAKAEKCILIRFDVPNVLKPTYENQHVQKLLIDLRKRCKKSPKSTFPKHTVMMDISKTEDELISQMDQKTRYNVRLGARQGIEVRLENNEEAINIFSNLMNETAKRQGFLAHSKRYYEKVLEVLSSHNMANLLIAYHENKPLAAWMLFNYKNTLYYPYGASTADNRNLKASNLLAWEAIKYGKRLGCTQFDMWGAKDDKSSDGWGFTKFKLSYGGELVEFIDSYDFIINPLIYYPFNLAYGGFWKILKGILRLRR